MKPFRSTAVVASLLMAVSLSACSDTGTLLGAGAVTGVAAAEERGITGTAGDTRIRLALNHYFFQEDHKLYSDIEFTVREGRVLLMGRLPDEKARALAVTTAWRAEGVTDVINEIQIGKGGMLDYGRDVWLANSLRTKLLFDEHIAAINYSVDVVGASVYLMGIAQNQTELDRVIDHARTLGGVESVVSHVRVKDL